MTDKVCNCQFCIDYKRFQEVLPTIPAEHREWFESIFDALWNTQEELSYKKAILDGSWPDSVVILEHHLANARKLKQLEDLANTPLNFDCKVCEICNKAMTSAQYWSHPCNNPQPEPHYEHTCDVVDISDGPCGDPSHDEPKKCGCGGNLVERTNSNTGNTFIGCSEFPTCKYTERGGSNPAPAKVSYNYEEEYEDEVDDGFMGGDHLGDFF